MYLLFVETFWQNRSFRLYSNTVVVLQKVFDKLILHEVLDIIDAKW